MTGEFDGIDPVVLDCARQQIRAVLGTSAHVLRVAAAHGDQDTAVLLLVLAGPPGEVVLKLARASTLATVDFQRTASVMAMARTAGVPTAQVLAADSSCESGPLQYLLLEHVRGEEWRTVRPQLDRREVDEAHRQLAEAVVALQSVRLAAFGELDQAGQPSGTDLVTSLRRRAELRVTDPVRRELFNQVLDRDGWLFDDPPRPTLCHDDLHHANTLFDRDHDGWRLAALLDWDKAWAGPAESDVARMAFWDDMTGPGFWETYRSSAPSVDGQAERTLIHQLLWCLEYDADTPRHRADTAAVCRRLHLRYD